MDDERVDRRLRFGLMLASIPGIADALSRYPGPDNLGEHAPLLARWSLLWLGTAWGWWSTITCVGVGLLLLSRRTSALAGAGLLFVCAACASFAEGATERGLAGVSHGVMLPGAMLATYILATLAKRSALEACSGIFAAGYLLAGTTKLRASGFSWLDGPSLGLLIAERNPFVFAPLQPFALWVATHTWACWVLIFTALVVELSGPLMLWPKARPYFAPFSVSLHLGIGSLMSYYHIEWPITVSMLAFATLATRPTAPRAG